MMCSQLLVLLVSVCVVARSIRGEILCSEICSHLHLETQQLIETELNAAERKQCEEECENQLVQTLNEKRVRGHNYKGLNLFARIGKSTFDEPEQLEDGSQTQLQGTDEKRLSSFVRIGKSPRTQGAKRTSSFIRIGKSPLEGNRVTSLARSYKLLADEGNEGENVDEKRASSFVRIGRSVGDDAKRAASFVTIGKSDLRDEEEKRLSSFVRIGKSSLGGNEDKRASFVRIGKSPVDELEEKRASSFVRIGKATIEGEDVKRASSFVRIGKSNAVEPASNDEVEKRTSSFVRIGKSFEGDNEKRASSFVRIGKSDASEGELVLPGIQRRASSFVRIGKSDSPVNDNRFGFDANQRFASIARVRNTPPAGRMILNPMLDKMAETHSRF